jgi:hypothetical protein
MISSGQGSAYIDNEALDVRTIMILVSHDHQVPITQRLGVCQGKLVNVQSQYQLQVNIMKKLKPRVGFSNNFD